MVLYTGDTHGRFERIIGLVQRLHLTADDVIVILGDAGFNFYGNEHGDAKRKKQVDRLGVPIFCIHGNHEMRPATISSYSVQTWHGGQVWVEPEYPNLLFARDGEIYDLDGKQAIVLGGAYSVDKFYRLMQNPLDPKWWPDEQPDDAIKQRAERVLEKNHWKVDLVLSHTCPAKYIPTEAFLPGLDQQGVDQSTEQWLDKIEDRLEYEAWLCGHWHIEKIIDRLHFVFEDILQID